MGSSVALVVSTGAVPVQRTWERDRADAVCGEQAITTAGLVVGVTFRSNATGYSAVCVFTRG